MRLSEPWSRRSERSPLAAGGSFWGLSFLIVSLFLSPCWRKCVGFSSENPFVFLLSSPSRFFQMLFFKSFCFILPFVSSNFPVYQIPPTQYHLSIIWWKSSFVEFLLQQLFWFAVIDWPFSFSLWFIETPLQKPESIASIIFNKSSKKRAPKNSNLTQTN